MERYLIGIDVGGTNIKIMIMTDTFHCLSKSSIKTQAEMGYDKIVDNIIGAIDGMFHEKGICNPDIASIAMGVPGIVDKKKKSTIHLNLLHWDGFDPSAKIGEYYQAPTVLENDANIHALGEFWFGGGKNTDSIVLLTLGTGVGGGIIVNGKILGGVNNLAAELGHMTIVADGGNICLCGRRGCLEAYASGSALERETIQMMNTHPNTKLHTYIKENGGVYDNSMVTRGVHENDEVCIEIMNWFVHYLSIGVANVMKILNPEVILLGGGVAEAGDVLMAPVNQQCLNRVYHDRQCCPVKKAVLGAEAGMYGACVLAGQAINLDISKCIN